MSKYNGGLPGPFVRRERGIPKMKKTICLTVLISVMFGCASQLANISWDLKPASRDGYGFTAGDPIRIGYSKDIRNNIDLCQSYIASLRTLDQQPLRAISRASVDDPKNKPDQPRGFLGMPLRSGVPKGGILDLYVLIPESGTDTFRLYFDIYHKDTLLVPRGLNFVTPTQ